MADKDKKEFTADLKKIYHVASEESGIARLEEVCDKCNERYPNAMKSWNMNWDVNPPAVAFFKDLPYKNTRIWLAFKRLYSGKVLYFQKIIFVFDCMRS